MLWDALECSRRRRSGSFDELVGDRAAVGCYGMLGIKNLLGLVLLLLGWMNAGPSQIHTDTEKEINLMELSES